MAAITRDIDIEAPIEVVFDAIADFESYPKFLEGMKKVKVLSKKGDHLTVEFTLEMFKRVVYTIDVTLEKPEVVSWTLVEADLMKKNNGGWVLTELDMGRTNAQYSLDIDFKIWVPGPISDFLVNSSIPKTLEAFKKKAEAMHGKKGKKARQKK